MADPGPFFDICESPSNPHAKMSRLTTLRLSNCAAGYA